MVCFKNLILNKKPEKEILDSLNFEDSLAIVVLLFKKSFIPSNIKVDFYTILKNRSFMELFEHVSFKTKPNLRSLQETILNRTIRKTFDKWNNLKSTKLSGKIQYHTKFFKFIFQEIAEQWSKNEGILIEDALKSLIKKFTARSQMDRKERIKGLHKMNSRKSKFLNLVIRKEQIKICLQLITHNKLFAESFFEIKKEILDEYSNFEIFGTEENQTNLQIENEFKDKINKKNKSFSFNLETMIYKAIYKIKEFQKKLDGKLDGSKIKKELRNLKLPFTKSEILMAFELI